MNEKKTSKKQLNKLKEKIKKKRKLCFKGSFGVKGFKGKKGKQQKLLKWRKPHGIDSKRRKRCKAKGLIPKIGYRNEKIIRGLHPSGLNEIIVNNLNEIKPDYKENFIIRIASKVGRKKAIEMTKKAKDLGLKLTREFK